MAEKIRLSRPSRTKLAKCTPRSIDTQIQVYSHQDQETMEYFEKIMGDDTGLQVRIVMCRLGLVMDGFRWGLLHGDQSSYL
jgi:hypothetical protein